MKYDRERLEVLRKEIAEEGRGPAVNGVWTVGRYDHDGGLMSEDYEEIHEAALFEQLGHKAILEVEASRGGIHTDVAGVLKD